MANYFEFNGHKSSEYGLIVNGVNIFSSPNRIVDKINIPYRNGDLLIDTGVYSNIIVTYTISMLSPSSAPAIADWLLNTSGYAVLKDTYNPTEFRMASYYNDINYQMTMLYRYGQANISFDCKPQRYLVSGSIPVEITNARMMPNPTSYPAKPLITVIGNGSFTINNNTITVTNNASGMWIDCEAYQCSYGSVNHNNDVTFSEGWPVLKAGENNVNKGTVTTLYVKPNWWRI